MARETARLYRIGDKIMRRSVSMNEQEVEMFLLIRQLLESAQWRDTDIVVQKRGNHLRVCSVGMPERLTTNVATLTKPKHMR